MAGVLSKTRQLCFVSSSHARPGSCATQSVLLSRKATAAPCRSPWLRELLSQQRREKVLAAEPTCCRFARVVTRSRTSVDNRELLTGDCLILVSFCLYKQITAIILHPTFPGWFAPLKFNFTRFEELASFATTLVVSWILSSLLVGGYRSSATADLPTALTRVSLAWLVSMPVAACQLVLLTAAEDRTLVGGDLFASALPLAASGPGEPLATAAGVLGLMSLWRCFYTVFLDFFNSRQWGGSGARIDRYQEMRYFSDTLKLVFLLSIACVVVIQFLAQNVGEEAIERFVAPLTWLLP